MNTQSPGAFDRFIARLRRIDARRDTTDGWLGGVCAGIANRVGVAPVLMRAVAILLVLSGIGLVAYLVAWCLLPDENDRVILDEARADRGQLPTVVVVITVLALVVSSPWNFGFDVLGHAGPIISLLAIAGLAVHVSRQQRRREETAPTTDWAPPTYEPSVTREPGVTAVPAGYGYGYGYGYDSAGSVTAPSTATATTAREHYRAVRRDVEDGVTGPRNSRAQRRARRRRTRMPLGAMLLLLGAALLAPWALVTGWRAEAVESPVPWLAFISLAVVSFGGLVLALRGYRIGVLSLLVVPLMFVSGTFATLHQEGYSTRTSALYEQPTSLTSSQTYDAGFGGGTVDLTQVNLASMPSAVDVTARLTAGRLAVFVPRGVKVELTSRTRLGNVTIDDGNALTYAEYGASVGSTPTRRTIGSGPKTIRLSTDVGMGDTRITMRKSSAP